MKTALWVIASVVALIAIYLIWWNIKMKRAAKAAAAVVGSGTPTGTTTVVTTTPAVTTV